MPITPGAGEVDYCDLFIGHSRREQGPTQSDGCRRGQVRRHRLETGEAELDNYNRVGAILSILKSRARQVLKARPTDRSL